LYFPTNFRNFHNTIKLRLGPTRRSFVCQDGQFPGLAQLPDKVREAGNNGEQGKHYQRNDAHNFRPANPALRLTPFTVVLDISHV
jgi:hypothetical protein